MEYGIGSFLLIETEKFKRFSFAHDFSTLNSEKRMFRRAGALFWRGLENIFFLSFYWTKIFMFMNYIKNTTSHALLIVNTPSFLIYMTIFSFCVRPKMFDTISFLYNFCNFQEFNSLDYSKFKLFFYWADFSTTTLIFPSLIITINYKWNSILKSVLSQISKIGCWE